MYKNTKFQYNLVFLLMFNKLLTLKPEIFINGESHQSVVITAAVYSCTKQIHIKYESNSFFRPP